MPWESLFDGLEKRDGSWTRIREELESVIVRGRENNIEQMKEIRSKAEMVCRVFANAVGAELLATPEELRWIGYPAPEGEIILTAPMAILGISHPLFPIEVGIYPKVVLVQRHKPYSMHEQSEFIVSKEDFTEEWLAKVLVRCEGHQIQTS